MIFKYFVNFLNKKDAVSRNRILESELEHKDAHIAALQALNEKLIITQIKLGKKEYMKLKDEILAIFQNEPGELDAQQIFDRIDTSKLRNKKPTLRTIRSTIHYLQQKKRLRSGRKKGTYCATGWNVITTGK